MIITTVMRMERTDAMLEFHLAVDRPPSEGGPPSLSVLQYLIKEQVLQTPDGVECFCVINDDNDTLRDLAIIYGQRYRRHIAVVTIKTKM